MTTDDIISAIIRREGSAYTVIPGDRGGPTKFGITLSTLCNYHHDDACTADEVRALTEAEARAIYREMYVDRPGFGKLTNDALKSFMVDWGVNSGPKVPIRHLQARFNVETDGVLGPLTLNKANTQLTQIIYDGLVDDRAAFYEAIVRHDPIQAKFLRGWLARNDEFKGALV